MHVEHSVWYRLLSEHWMDGQLIAVTVTITVPTDWLSTDVSTDWTFSLLSRLPWVERIGNC